MIVIILFANDLVSWTGNIHLVMGPLQGEAQKFAYTYGDEGKRDHSHQQDNDHVFL